MKLKVGNVEGSRIIFYSNLAFGGLWGVGGGGGGNGGGRLDRNGGLFRNV